MQVRLLYLIYVYGSCEIIPWPRILGFNIIFLCFGIAQSGKMTGSVSLGLLYLWKISYAVIEILVLVSYLALFLILACEVDLYFASTTQVIYALTSMSSKATVVCKNKKHPSWKTWIGFLRSDKRNYFAGSSHTSEGEMMRLEIFSNKAQIQMVRSLSKMF